MIARGQDAAIRRLILAGGIVFLGACRPDEGRRTDSPAGPEKGTVVTVAAAADLRFAFDALLAGLHRAEPDLRVVVSYGSSGSFYSQLVHGAPFDLFLSADIAYPRMLVEAGLAGATGEFTYARGFLVMWVPEQSPLEPARNRWETLNHPSVRKIAIANPAHTPYGRAAEAAMKSAGVYDAVRDRLVPAENIAQAAQFVDTGAADVGLIALSLALAPTMRDRGRYWKIPADSYPAIDQGGVILLRTRELPGTQRVRDYLMGGEARAVMKRYGFSVPGE